MKLWRQQISLRTFLILCVIVPPLIAWGVHTYYWRRCPECAEWVARQPEVEWEVHQLIHLILKTQLPIRENRFSGVGVGVEEDFP